MFNWLRERLSVLFDGGHPRDSGLARLFGFGVSTASGQQVSEETSQTLSAVYAAVRIYAETISQMPLPVFSRRVGGGRDEAVNHPAWKILNYEFNSEMSAVVGRETLERYAQLWGNACAEISWDGAGRPVALWPLEPWRVVPDRDPDGSLVYVVDGKRRVAPPDMFHLPGMGNGVWGKSVIRYAAESLGVSLAAQQYGAAFFGNGAIPGGVLEHPKRLGPVAAETLRKQFTDRHQGAGKSGSVFIAEEGMKYTRVGIPPEESQFLETGKRGVRDVARWWNLAPHLLRDMDDATFSNIEHQFLEMLILSMQPRCIRWEQEIGRKLLSPPRLYCRHNVNGLLRSDSTARSAFFREMFGIGVYTINKILELEDDNPIGPEGDKRFVNSAMIPIEKAGMDRQPTPPAKLDTPVIVDEQSVSDALTSRTELVKSHEALLSEATGRMLRKEINAVLRAADRPGEFLAWLDAFYDRHVEILAAAIAPAVASSLILLGEDDEPSRLSRELAELHVAESRAELLTASDGDPSEFKARVEACTVRWQQERAKFLIGSLCA